jgi:hypothetical protein
VKVLIRKSYAVSAQGRHDDLMVVYFDEPSKKSEGDLLRKRGADHPLYGGIGPDSAYSAMNNTG